jgi:hypothetical protein
MAEEMNVLFVDPRKRKRKPKRALQRRLRGDRVVGVYRGRDEDYITDDDSDDDGDSDGGGNETGGGGGGGGPYEGDGGARSRKSMVTPGGGARGFGAFGETSRLPRHRGADVRPYTATPFITPKQYLFHSQPSTATTGGGKRSFHHFIRDVNQRTM